jgi:hypothetical protein
MLRVPEFPGNMHMPKLHCVDPDASWNRCYSWTFSLRAGSSQRSDPKIWMTAATGREQESGEIDLKILEITVQSAFHYGDAVTFPLLDDRAEPFFLTI